MKKNKNTSYWEAIYKELEPVANDPLHIVLAGIDANARVGSISCPAVGKIQPTEEKQKRKMAQSNRHRMLSRFNKHLSRRGKYLDGQLWPLLPH